MHCRAAAAAIDWEQGYYEMMSKRIKALVLEPPLNWTAVHIADEK